MPYIIEFWDEITQQWRPWNMEPASYLVAEAMVRDREKYDTVTKHRITAVEWAKPAKPLSQ